MNFLEQLLNAMGADASTRHFLQEADRQHRNMQRLRENYELDIHSEQPAEPKSRALKFAAFGAGATALGGAGLAGIGAIQGGIDRYDKKYALRKQIHSAKKELAGYNDQATGKGAEIKSKLGKLRKTAGRMPGYLRSMAKGGIKGVTSPLSTLYRGAGLAYLDKRF